MEIYLFWLLSLITALGEGTKMALLKTWESFYLPLKNSAISFLKIKIGRVLDQTKTFISKVFPPLEVDVENLKNEVWEELSRIYFKYEDKVQKRAFREVVHEMSKKISEGKWDNVYKKLYRIEQNSARACLYV